MTLFLWVIFLFLSGASVGDAGISYSHLWGGFSTSLVNRSPEQANNADRAAKDLNGVIISPGGIFSFNDHVGARDTGKGYLPAPI
ncbi:MAG TPA: VanW family protein, partial [Geobacteraceae bacterium]|nr:VanW family protein [Geobacteraceae bacterium]